MNSANPKSVNNRMSFHCKKMSLNDASTNSFKRNLHVAAITGGENVPSRRFRIHALLPFLLERGIKLKELCPKISGYPPSSHLLRAPWLVSALMERFTFLYRSKGYDAIILQREMISTLPTLERLLPKPWILDVDDAIYLHRGGRAAEYAARSCSLVVCGNRYLAEKFSHWNSNIVVIPTGVDTEQLRPLYSYDDSKPKIIGWIGTSGNYRYLEMVKPVLGKILKCFSDVQLQIVSDKFPAFLKHFGDQLDFKLWRPNIENELLPSFTVGIMPLEDSEWARGKCAFKMLQYMAAGVPVVTSSVGMNKDIIKQCDAGVAATNNKQWFDALSLFLTQPDMRIKTGLNGRHTVEEKYSLKMIANSWDMALSKVLGQK